MSHHVTVERDVTVAMRDGVRLATDVYLPEGEGPFPTLLTRIRGSRSAAFIVGVLLLNPLEAVRRGYAVAVQEVRGRSGSEDSWHPFVHERSDGEDCLDWVAAQPWCDGRVGVYGTAYSASTALYVTGLARDEVKACAVLGTGADLHDGWVYTSGAFELGWNIYWSYMTLAESIGRLDVPTGELEELRRQYAEAIRRAPEVAARLPISDHPLLERGGDLQYREWLEHPDYDDYWRAVDVLAEPERLRAPLLSIVGWWDNFLKSHFDLYRALAPHAPHRLVCGPWEHTNYVSPFSTSRTGAIEHGPAAASGVGVSGPLVLDWMDRWLKGEERGAAGRRALLAGRRERVARDGALAAAARRAALAPARRRRPDDGAAGRRGAGPVPVRPARPGADDRRQDADADDLDRRDRGPERARSSATTSSSSTPPPSQEPLVVHGRARVELWASSSAPDTDFTAKLDDVAPDGFVANIADGIVRARYRDSPRHRSQPLVPGEPTRFEIDLWDLAHTFQPGHRIRVEISSSNFPRFDRNTNTGNELGADSADDVVAADQQVCHDAARPSALVLPVAAS